MTADLPPGPEPGGAQRVPDSTTPDSGSTSESGTTPSELGAPQHRPPTALGGLGPASGEFSAAGSGAPELQQPKPRHGTDRTPTDSGRAARESDTTPHDLSKPRRNLGATGRELTAVRSEAPKSPRKPRRGSDDTALFDLPGPRSRRRIRIATGISLVVFAALLALVVRQFAVHGQLAASQWRPYTLWPIDHYLLVGAQDTLLVTVVAAALAFPFGGALALMRLSRNVLPRLLARGYTELLRALPLLLLLYLFLFGLPRLGLALPPFWQLVVPIALTNAAVIAELIRAGVAALDRGQDEAALSLGMSHWQSMRYVVLPQAIRSLVPALVSQLVRLLKDSTLGYVVSFLELLHRAQVLGEYNHTVLSAYLVAAAAFVVVNASLAKFANWLEHRV
ncbi:amino acid ABC transporter permease [Nocardia alni]|uniref:amino acid ABC transporter permease n=1 Tax=Nocardia alni TaxID=2815723 RepID=UPI001C2248C1|nr:amino acid ABC transporter permease [Nocardia alni]